MATTNIYYCIVEGRIYTLDEDMVTVMDSLFDAKIEKNPSRFIPQKAEWIVENGTPVEGPIIFNYFS